MPQTDCRKPKLSLHFSKPKGPVCRRWTTAPFFFKSLTLKLTCKFFRAQTNSPVTTATHNRSARSCQLKRKAVFFSNTSHAFSPRASYPTVTSPELFTAECCQAKQRTQMHTSPKELCFHVSCTQANDQLAHRSWLPD